MSKRYNKTGYFYPTYYSVQCPECKREAVVSYEGAVYRPENVGAKCISCTYSSQLEDEILYKLTVKRNCPNCGKPIFKEIENLKDAYKSVSVTCQNCDFDADYEPIVTKYNTRSFRMAKDNLKRDKFFGHPLWLQIDVRGNLFWAYNREHLAEIEAFVEADLRERQFPYLMTMVARLPDFVKSKKNRELILKKIKEMRDL